MIQKGLIYVVFFLSGVAALTFETLWFRQAGLAFGNSVWAGSMVLASFMAGLAIGNWIAGKHGHRTSRPIAAYGWIEILIGVSGLGLVLLFPHVNELLIPILRPAFGQPLLLNTLRLTLAFCFLLVPTVAMGATLPLMVSGLASPDVRFGQRLGALYATNTLGAMAGALACEFLLIGPLGIRGTAVVAACCNVVAGLTAMSMSRTVTRTSDQTESAAQPLNARGRRILVGAFLAGCSLLALEVVWFRFMALFYFGTTQVFATMLAIVLGGIGMGGFIASRWMKREDASRFLPIVAFGSGLLTVLTFGLLGFLSVGSLKWHSSPAHLALPLMFPVSTLSGMLFTLMGQALHDERASDARAAGLLTLSNTTGAMCGAWLGGFVLLPFLGMQNSFLTLAGAYAVVGLLCVEDLSRYARSSRVALVAMGCGLVVVLAGFPPTLDDLMFRKTASSFLMREGDRIAAMRETVTGTVMYAESQFLGQPTFHRLITDGHSMSSTHPRSAHYMKQYVYMPVAMHPGMKKACLISFGCGVTARSLTDTKEFEQIDIVDISKDILQMNSVIYPDPAQQPLRDPRVRVFVEDGRYHLLTTPERYDLITSEPPPPKGANVVNLYTREYFQLIKDRLAPGGMTSYWLPHHSLAEGDSRAIVRAFCDVFEESSLWLGSGEDWMLLGVNEGFQKVDDRRFRKQWNDASALPRLASCGFEKPELVGAAFIGDVHFMREFTKGTEPLVDNFPYRLNPDARRFDIESRYVELLNVADSKRRFLQSEHVRKFFPDSLRESSLAYFDVRPEMHDIWSTKRIRMSPNRTGGLRSVHGLVKNSDLNVPVLWTLGSSQEELEAAQSAVAKSAETAPALFHMGHSELAVRHFEKASHYYALARQMETGDRLARHQAVLCLAYAMCMDGKVAEAQLELIQSMSDARNLHPLVREDLNFLSREFGLSVPTSVAAAAPRPTATVVAR